MVVELLLKHGADLAAPCTAGKTAMHYAAEVGVSAGMMGLLSHPAAADQSQDGFADQPDESVDESADQSATLPKDGQPAQTPAAQRRDGRLRTPLHYAAAQGNWTNVKLLLEVGSRPIAISRICRNQYVT